MENIYNPYAVDAEISEEVLNLPGSIQQILFSASTPYFLEALCKTYGLSKDQSADLSRIIRDTILGNSHVGDMASVVSTRLSLDQNNASQIYNRIVNELFAPAKEDIEKMHGEKFPEANQNRGLSPRPDVNQNNIIDLRNRSQS